MTEIHTEQAVEPSQPRIAKMNPEHNVWVCSGCLPDNVAVYTVPFIGTGYCAVCNTPLGSHDNGQVKAGHLISAKPIWDQLVGRLVRRVKNHLDWMAPHIRQRETARMLSDLLMAYEELEKSHAKLDRPLKPS